MIDINKLAHELKTQDNDCTADPIFLVQRRERTYGFDPAFTDDTVFLNSVCDYEEVDLDEWGITVDEALERDDLIETGFKDDWDFVNAHFTRKSAERFIESNRHRYPNGLRVYVDSMYRCPEMIAIRDFLLMGA